MIETDYVWLKPLVALPAEAPTSRAQAFPFGYIAPQVAPIPLPYVLRAFCWFAASTLCQIIVSTR